MKKLIQILIVFGLVVMMGGVASYLHIIDTSTNTMINNFNLGTDVTATGLAVMQGTCSNCD